MVAALTRLFGFHNLALAEDVVQDAFCRALEVWKFRGVPDNPSAWLMATARNRAIDVLRRERTARTFAPELGRLLESEWTLVPMVDELLGGAAVKDDLLRIPLFGPLITRAGMILLSGNGTSISRELSMIMAMPTMRLVVVGGKCQRG